MADQAEEKTNGQHLAVLKELSDIKASIAVNTTETANIKFTVSEIKSDIRDIKEDFVNRREFNEGLKALRDEVAPLKKFVYGLIAVVMLSVLGAIINLFLMNNH